MSGALLLALALLAPLRAQVAPGRLNIAVNEADLKDVLRAATAGTDYNLIFEPGLETRLQGLNLKAMTLDEILDQVLPTLGLECRRQGRNLLIQKSESSLRFYHVDQLAMARSGTKSFQVNGSGQTLQQGQGQGQGSAAGAAGTSGNASGSSASAYTSSIQAGETSDPWADLESGLVLLVFGKGTAAAAPAQAAGPGARTFSEGGRTLLIQPNAGLVGVGADPATQRRVEAFLKETRQRTQRQVLLEARIVEVNLTDGSQMGVDWNAVLKGAGNASSFSTLQFNQTGAGVLQLVAQSSRVSAALTAMAQDNRLKVLSMPRLSTLNNQKAVLRVVQEQAYALNSSQITPGTAAGGAISTSQITPLIVPVGIVLDIQPQIGDDGVITLAVNPSISDVGNEKSFDVPNPGGGYTTTTLPVVDRRDLDAIVRIRSGETLVLAGIIQTRETAANQGVPWLRRIPILGSLLSSQTKNRSRTELAIFITPTLMEDGAQIVADSKGVERRLDSAGAQVRPPDPKAPASWKEP